MLQQAHTMTCLLQQYRLTHTTCLQVLRSACKKLGGLELQTEGDAFLMCFTDPWQARAGWHQGRG